MKPMLRVLSLLLTVAMLLALCACGDDSKKDKKDGDENEENSASANVEEDDDSFAYCMQSEDAVELGKPDKPIQRSAVYSKVNYTAKMLGGYHDLLGGEEAYRKLAGDVGYYPDYRTNGDAVIDLDNRQVSLLPFSFNAGKHTLLDVCTYIDGYDWCKLSFITDNGETWQINCTYEVEGNTLRCYPLNSLDYSEEKQTIRYSLSDFYFEYEFELKGMDLILKKDGKSVTLSTGYDGNEEPDLYADGYVVKGGEMLDNIKNISLFYSEDADLGSFANITDNAGQYYYNCAAKLTRNGVLTLTVPWKSGTKTYQYVCFYCGHEGLVLTDGNKYYDYTTTYSDIYGDSLGDTITIEDAGRLKDVDEEKLQEIVQKKDDLAADLVEAFKKVGIAVQVNAATGEISMDSTVLFGGDSSTITPEGEKVLQKFISTYTTVILDQKYEGFISKIMVEGHTAPVNNNSYEDGLPLSQERADKVKAYCCSDKAGLSADAKAKIGDMMQAVGMSNSDPVKDADGNVDMAASRRVCFRFIVNIE